MNSLVYCISKTVRDYLLERKLGDSVSLTFPVDLRGVVVHEHVTNYGKILMVQKTERNYSSEDIGPFATPHLFLLTKWGNSGLMSPYEAPWHLHILDNDYHAAITEYNSLQQVCEDNFQSLGELI